MNFLAMRPISSLRMVMPERNRLPLPRPISQFRPADKRLPIGTGVDWTKLSEAQQRLYLRNQVMEENKRLASTAKRRWCS